ncbi:lipopolysaccharide heptosyltransferase II [candidate division KSB1 bacterium]|nr:lipopolysaccharide heptosyltransferase II [candidate division KSB1 bacterium]
MAKRKLLILQTAFIGDVILATPLAQAAHEMFAPCEVHFMVIPGAANLLEKNPYIQRVWVYDKRGKQRGARGLWQLARQLRAERFQLALVPHRSLRSALLVWIAKIPQRIGFNRSAGAFLFTDKIIYEAKHEVERNLDLLRGLGALASRFKPAVYWDESDEARVASFTKNSFHNRIALAPGSVWATKRWPQESFAVLARRLINETGATIFLIGGKDDAVLCEQIQKKAGARCVNTAGQLSLRQSAALLNECAVLVSNDSAPAHLGVATRCRVLMIFGPTVPRFGFAPFGEGHAVIEKDMVCRPCSTHGTRTCPIGTHACMKEISVEEVFHYVVASLA